MNLLRLVDCILRYIYDGFTKVFNKFVVIIVDVFDLEIIVKF